MYREHLIISLYHISSLRVHRNTPFLTRMETPVPVCRVQCLTSGSNYHRLMAASRRLTITANMDLVTAAYCVVCDNSDNIATLPLSRVSARRVRVPGPARTLGGLPRGPVAVQPGRRGAGGVIIITLIIIIIIVIIIISTSARRRPG